MFSCKLHCLFWYVLAVCGSWNFTAFLLVGDSVHRCWDGSGFSLWWLVGWSRFWLMDVLFFDCLWDKTWNGCDAFAVL
jgi:hypothetical protein